MIECINYEKKEYNDHCSPYRMARLYGAPYAWGYRRMGIVPRQDIRRLSQVVAVSPDSGNVLPATVAYGVFLLRETAAMAAS